MGTGPSRVRSESEVGTHAPVEKTYQKTDPFDIEGEGGGSPLLLSLDIMNPITCFAELANEEEASCRSAGRADSPRHSKEKERVRGDTET